MVKFLNLGCGYHYCSAKEWVNFDFRKTGDNVTAVNLLLGIPEPDNSVDLVYHSHVLEHFPKPEGEIFIEECIRVLKPGGIIRIAVPDLEGIVRNYLSFLDKGVKEENNSENRGNYDWSMLEMLDQTVRNRTGGLMADYLAYPSSSNNNFVMERLGKEGDELLTYLMSDHYKNSRIKSDSLEIDRSLKSKIKRFLLRHFFSDIEVKSIEDKAYEEIGRFRSQGEIHQWMYDRYSLKFLLERAGCSNFQVKSFKESGIDNWNEYQLDEFDGVIRKPCSLFIEAKKL